jgi:thymidylate synthase
MHIRFRNVNDALRELVEIFGSSESNRAEHGVKARPYSNPNGSGNTLYLEEPVLITYERPRERVLFNEVRDANPFFHLYESLWMLAGRNDVAPLAYYNSKIEGFSDDGKTFNGAYGHRWKNAVYGSGRQFINQETGEAKMFRPGVDQLKIVIDHLKANPASRRAVVSMWNVENDLLKIDTRSNYPCCEGVRRVERVPGDATTLIGGSCPVHGATFYQAASKDVCCNLDVMLSLRDTGYGLFSFKEAPHEPLVPLPGTARMEPVRVLDIMVTNRSNDLLWGLLGANYVQFSMLQEYLAACIGVEVGKYHHMSNNLHVYDGRADWKPEALLAAHRDLYLKEVACETCGGEGRVTDSEVPQSFSHYFGKVKCAVCDGRGYLPDEKGPPDKDIPMVPLVEVPETFDEELAEFVERHQRDAMANEYEEPFLATVAQPMCVAWHYHKRRDYEKALTVVSTVASADWKIAARTWLEKRAFQYAAKS